MLTLYPAIDLHQGEVVRLKRGEEAARTVYYADAKEPARLWHEAGAGWVHVVDLDGAFRGTPANREALRGILGVGMRVQLGGGLRTVDALKAARELGVQRLVIGTSAAREPDFIKAALEAVGPAHLAVGIDAKDGQVAVQGWVETMDLKATDFAQQCADLGVRTIIYTDIARDGMMSGPNIPQLEGILQAVECDVIASGGVSQLDDLCTLRQLGERYPQLHGVITGKALYDGAFPIGAALAAVA